MADAQRFRRACKILERLLDKKAKSKSVEEEIDLLTLLVESWDDEHNTFVDLDSVELLKSLMENNNLKKKEEGSTCVYLNLCSS